MKAIRTSGLTKKYGDFTAVDSLNLEINEGELYSLLGINGAGKTTTVRMLSCLTGITDGDAEILGKSVKDSAEEVRKVIAVSPQETAVAPKLTVRENLELMAGIHGFQRERRDGKIRELCDSFDFHAILSKRAEKLSGGWIRRLSIAMALISEPKVLFLDEPTLGLDVIARSELRDTVRALKGRVTVVLTTHYMEEAEALSDRIGIMASGRLIAEGTADELKSLSGKEKFEEAFVEIVRGTK